MFRASCSPHFHNSSIITCTQIHCRYIFHRCVPCFCRGKALQNYMLYKCTMDEKKTYADLLCNIACLDQRAGIGSSYHVNFPLLTPTKYCYSFCRSENQAHQDIFAIFPVLWNSHTHNSHLLPYLSVYSNQQLDFLPSPGFSACLFLGNYFG